MVFTQAPSHRALKDYIHSYLDIEFDKDFLTKQCNSGKMIPDGYIEIWFLKTAPLYYYQKDDGRFIKMPQCFIWGQMLSYSRLFSFENCTITSVRLYPWASDILFGLPCIELTGQYVDLQNVNKRLFSILENCVYSSESLSDFLHLFEKTIIQKLEAPSPKKEFVQTAFHKILEQEGLIKVNQLSQYLGRSRQHLNRVFKKVIGLSPKKLCTVVKIRKSIDLESQKPSRSLTELAYRFDYFDQSHFIRDFKSVTGDSPKVFFGEKHLTIWHIS